MCIVTHRVDRPLFESVLEALSVSVEHARKTGRIGSAELVIVNNGDVSDHAFLASCTNAPLGELSVRLIDNTDNVGFGRAHNQGLADCESDVHLILNPDAILTADALASGLSHLIGHSETVLVTPYVENPDGGQEFLCKRYPTVLDLFIRGFVPRRLQNLAEERLARYECRDYSNQEVHESVAIASGCCMLARTETLQDASGFSEDYFLYFEDFELSLKLSQLGRIDFVPAMRIVHHGGNASAKGLKHIVLFCRSAFTFFTRNGWKFI